jgi:hypothetical protein
MKETYPQLGKWTVVVARRTLGGLQIQGMLCHLFQKTMGRGRAQSTVSGSNSTYVSDHSLDLTGQYNGCLAHRRPAARKQTVEEVV